MLGYLLLAERLINYITAQVKSKLSLTPICADTSTSYGKELDFGLVIPGPTAHIVLGLVRLDGNIYTCS